MTKIILPIIVFFSSAFFFGCQTDTKKVEEPNIKMAAILPLTGSRASDAHMARRGMEIAVEEINLNAQKNKLPKVELKYADTQSSYINSDAIVEAVQNSGAKVIHAGFTDDIVFSVKKLGEKNDTLVNFFCDYPPAAVQVKNAVRIYPNGAQICEQIARAANVKAERFGDKKILIVNVDTPAGKSCADYLKFQTGSSNFKTFVESFKEGEKNFDIFAKQVMNINPDYILVYASKNSAYDFLNALKKVGYKGVFASNETSDKPILSSSKDIEVFEVETAFTHGDSKPEKMQKFVDAFKRKFNVKPNFLAAFAYDSIIVTYDAMLAANSDAKVAREMLLDKNFNGASGEIAIDKLGDMTSNLSFNRK